MFELHYLVLERLQPAPLKHLKVRKLSVSDWQHLMEVLPKLFPILGLSRNVYNRARDLLSKCT